MTSSVTFPLLATKYPRAHRCRPQNSFRRSPKIRQQMVRCLALDGLHHSARRQTWRHAQQQMHMGSAHVTAYNFDVVAATDLPNQLPHPQCHITPQHRLAVLRGKYEMIVQQINCVR